MADEFTILTHERLFEGRVFTIERDTVRHASGYESIREVVRHDGGAVIVPILPGPDVLLIRQFRYPVNREIIELPAGKLSPGEDPMHCAVRELREETGYTAAEMLPLVSMLTTPGFCSETLHLFMATGLTDGAQALEQGEESIALLRTPLAEAMRMCGDGRITDGKTVTGLTLAALKLGVLNIESDL
ncbi:MAG: NUDIX hydrolase [Bacteroidia bacterium]|nr:NUDIX hydrolase [Bacteroidia bacterium]